MPRSHHKAPLPPQATRGVAAVEFALIMALVMLLLGGLVVYWNWIQTKQSVVKATGDGARMLYELAQGSMAEFDPEQTGGRQAIGGRVTTAVVKSLGGSGLQDAGAAQVSIEWETAQARIQVIYPHQFFGGFLPESVRPQALRAVSTVRLSGP